MKRFAALAAVLIVCLALWGAIQVRDRNRQRWIETAPRTDLAGYVAGHPDDADALARMSRLLRNAGEKAEAEKLIRRAVAIAPHVDDNWVEFSRSVSGDREADEALQGFLRVNPDSAPVLSELARRSLRGGDIDGARSQAEKATKVSPGSPEAWRSMGEVLAAERNMPKAEEALRRSLSLRDEADTRLSLAHILIPLQRYAEIMGLCEPMVRAPKSQDISLEQRARALAYYAGSRLYEPLSREEQISLRAQLLEADSISSSLPPDERFMPAYFMGESCLRSGKPKDAIPFLERSAAAAPAFPGALYSLARAYRLSGDVAKANSTASRHTRLSRLLGDLDSYRSRLEQRPDDEKALFSLADTLNEMGNTADAARIYQRLISQGRSAELAKRKLEALKGPH